MGWLAGWLAGKQRSIPSTSITCLKRDWRIGGSFVEQHGSIVNNKYPLPPPLLACIAPYQQAALSQSLIPLGTPPSTTVE